MDRSGIQKLVATVEEDEEMDVREPSLLEFDRVDVCDCLSKDPLLEDCVQ